MFESVSQRLAARRAADRESGFTLVELLVVLAILVLLVALVAPQVLKYLDRARVDTARIQIQALGNAIDFFRLNMQRYPTQEEGLAVLVTPPPDAQNWQGPYLKPAKVPLDPWGRAYIYRFPGEHSEFDLYTLGPDVTPGRVNENSVIANWQ